jgi:hypothetical protein
MLSLALVILALLLPPLAQAEEISEGARQFLAKQPHELARGDGSIADAYGVPVTQQDMDLYGAVGICTVKKGDDRNPPDVSFWPELAQGAPANQPPGPCAIINQKYEQSGAKAKYDRASIIRRTEQFNAVMKAAGKQ